MEHHPPEIQKEILIRLSVRDLIRCKRVCKSWRKMISRRDFIRSHLKHSYLSDQKDNAFGDRRLVTAMWPSIRYKSLFPHLKVAEFFSDLGIIGSCHGLVCASYLFSNVVVVNPATTEVKKVISRTDDSICFGFGYDEKNDDYKVFFGYKKGGKCVIKVFCLRSNIWKDLGEVNFVWLTRVGVLCKGLLHWMAYDTLSDKIIILSFNLSDETFTVLPETENVSYQSMIAQHYRKICLGTLDGCLCVFNHELLPNDLWVMKDYNNKQSWELFGCGNEMKPDAVYELEASYCLNYLIPNTRPFLHDPWFGHIKGILSACTYVESLVSPHFEKETGNLHHL